jgi:hypothetical protein
MGIVDEADVESMLREYLGRRSELLTRYMIFKAALEYEAKETFPTLTLYDLTKKQIVNLIAKVQVQSDIFDNDLWFGVGINLASDNQVGVMARLFSDILESDPKTVVDWMNAPAETLKLWFS